MAKTVLINGRPIGSGHPCYFILEGGVNFDDLKGAEALIDSAVAIGADCIKFQTFHAKTTTVPTTKLQDGRGEIDQYQEFEESESKQTPEVQKHLFDYCQKKKITSFSTPSHFNDVDALEKYAKLPAYKLGSDDLTNIPLIQYVARLGRPMIISSGVSHISEIDEAIRAIREEGNNDIVLLHCISQYPTNPKDINLRMMQTLMTTFDVPVGLSDHTMTTSVAMAAAALGACVIEKHYTLDRDAPGPDNFFSMLPDEMKTIIDGVREIESALGSPYKTIVDAEQEMRAVFKKSLHATRDITPGEVLSLDNVDILRPTGGLDPKYHKDVIGMKVTKKIVAGEAITWDCFK